MLLMWLKDGNKQEGGTTSHFLRWQWSSRQKNGLNYEELLTYESSKYPKWYELMRMVGSGWLKTDGRFFNNT